MRRTPTNPHPSNVARQPRDDGQVAPEPATEPPPTGATAVPHGRMRRPAPPVIAPWRRWLAALLAVGGMALIFGAREPIALWLWPETRTQQLRLDAAAALQAGHLTRPDGRGARELYEAALALDPDRQDARLGLARVGLAALAQADAAIRAGRIEQARQSLQLARDLEVPRALSDALAGRLHAVEVDDSGVDRLLMRAEAARIEGRLDGGSESALALYERLLQQQPNHARALEGREDTLADLLQLSRQAMARGALAEAGGLIRRVQAVDPGHVDLPEVLATRAQAASQRLERADAALRRGRLPEAVAAYRSVIDLEPDHAAAATGLLQVAGAYAGRSEAHAAEFRFAQAVAALDHAQAIAPESPAVAAARAHLARARQSRAGLESAVPQAERRRRVQRLLQEAAAAESRGDLLTPPGDSAFDKIGAARALSPSDPAVVNAAARLRPAARKCFDEALLRNRLTLAGKCLDAMATIEGTSGMVARDRGRLALRWIAFGDERLGAGDLQIARRALAAARAIDPAAAGLEQLSERVDAVTAARN